MSLELRNSVARVLGVKSSRVGIGLGRGSDEWKDEFIESSHRQWWCDL